MAAMTFLEALDDAADYRKRHLLLGNGFSIACRPNCFQYGSLLEEAEFAGLSVDPQALFDVSSTSDFERVIEMLRTSSEVLKLYDDGEGELFERLKQDAECVKKALADVLARKHPDHVHSLEEAEYSHARTFLSRFDGNLYTVNYDLLLYWALIQDEVEPELDSDDGFRADPDDLDAAYVVWEPYSNYRQRVFFLHGGLHLFDAGSQLMKVTYARTGVHLVEQIREALDRGWYPHVVTEGTSDAKIDAILHSAYLHRGLKSFSSCKGALFVYGHSLAESDEHVFRRVADGKFEALYVSLYGDPQSDTNRAICERAERLAVARPEKRPLSVKFYDAASAAVWEAA